MALAVAFTAINEKFFKLTKANDDEKAGEALQKLKLDVFRNISHFKNFPQFLISTKHFAKI